MVKIRKFASGLRMKSLKQKLFLAILISSIVILSILTVKGFVSGEQGLGYYLCIVIPFCIVVLNILITYYSNKLFLSVTATFILSCTLFLYQKSYFLLFYISAYTCLSIVTSLLVVKIGAD